MSDYYPDDYRQLEDMSDIEINMPPFGQQSPQEFGQFMGTPGQGFGPPFGPPSGGPGQGFGPPFGPPSGGPGQGFGPPFGPPFGGPGQGFGPPSGPPPSYIPQQTYAQNIGVYAVNPGAIRPCLYRYAYLWLTTGQQFWAWLVFVGTRSVAGWRWTGFRWVYFGVDLNQIASFVCY